MASEADTDRWEVYLRRKIGLFSKMSVYDFTPEGELFYAGGIPPSGLQWRLFFGGARNGRIYKYSLRSDPVLDPGH